MRKINPKCSDKDSCKCSILVSLHYYDINFHLERISKLIPFENKYNFNHNAPKEFEINNPNVSLTIFDENKNVSYTSKKALTKWKWLK